MGIDGVVMMARAESHCFFERIEAFAHDERVSEERPIVDKCVSYAFTSSSRPKSFGALLYSTTATFGEACSGQTAIRGSPPFAAKSQSRLDYRIRLCELPSVM